MVDTLFAIGGLAIFGWLPLLLIPQTRLARWLAAWTVFPVFLAVLYVVGIASVLARMGPGIMGDFGSAAGVTRLLSDHDLALVAWIHILAFDQLAALWIFQDNLRRRVVPLPVQSLLLVATLMFGPVAFVTYALVRMARGRSLQEAREMDAIVAARPQPEPARTVRLLGAAAADPVVLGLGFAGMALGAVVLAATVPLGAHIPPEGKLLEAGRFDVAVGLYLATLSILLPLASFTPRGYRTWRSWTVGLGIYFFGAETVQALRGIDPRFTTHGTAVDGLFNSFFGLSAVGVIVMFVLLAIPFVRGRSRATPLLRLALLYGTAAVAAGFGSGIWMSVIRGRITGPGGSIMPVHFVGFHGLQAVPLLALLLAGAGAEPASARRLVHVGGAAWLGACALLGLQAISGPPLAFSPANLAAAAALTLWFGVAVYSLAAWWAGQRRIPALEAERA